MLVFLSWSGARSRRVAEVLREWLPNVIQAVDPWMSDKDIDKGARWSADIADRLNEAKIGIVCLTSENLDAPWLLFEAGALSKIVGEAHVCPYLLDLSPTDLDGPLVQFQVTTCSKSDTFELLRTVNSALGDKPLPDSKLKEAFEKWWPDLEGRLEGIEESDSGIRRHRSDRELLEETLALVRRLVHEGEGKPLGISGHVRESDDVLKKWISKNFTYRDLASIIGGVPIAAKVEDDADGPDDRD